MKTMINLKDTISDVIATMCFMYEDSVPRTPKYEIDYQISAEDDFFDLEFFVGNNLAISLTKNLLGEEDEPTEEEVIDCLKEIVNTIIGQYVSRHYENHPALLPIPDAKKINKISENITDFKRTESFYDNRACIILYRDKK